MDDVTLATATFHQLVGELTRRYGQGGVVLVITEGKTGADERGARSHYWGGFTNAIGLVTRAQAAWLAESNELYLDGEEDDEEVGGGEQLE